MTEEIRDGSGNLVGYSGKNYEAMFVKLDGRIERLESNLGDARQDLQKLSTDIEHVREQVSGLCGLIHQLKNEVRVYAAIQTEANHENRLRAVEGQAKFIQGAAKVCLVLAGLGGTIWGIIKFIGGKP